MFTSPKTPVSYHEPPQLLNASVAKAIAVDEISPGASTSSCAEDAFFVAQRCARRALATGHAGAASAVVNHAGNTLGGDLLEAIVRKVWCWLDVGMV